MSEEPNTDIEKGSHNFASTQQLDSTKSDFHDQPPSYDSVLGKIKAAHETSDNKLIFVKTVWSLISTSFGFIILLGITLCLPIVNIVIGSVFLHDCTIQRYVPIYLVVGGVFTLAQTLVGLGNKIINRGQVVPQEERELLTPTERASNCFNSVTTCFMFAWFVAGNIWIYSIYHKVNTSDSASPQFCNYTLYYYAFWVTTLVYIITVLVFCCGWLMCCLVSCVGTSKK